MTTLDLLNLYEIITVALVPFFSMHGAALQPATVTLVTVIDPLTPATSKENGINIMYT